MTKKKSDKIEIDKNSSECVIGMLDRIPKPPEILLKKIGLNPPAYGTYPNYLETDDKPPKAIDDRTEIFPIDECLGLYKPDEREIIIFNKGIDKASEIIDCNPLYLKYIVKIHEWSHALIHLGLNLDERNKMNRDDNYREERLKNLTSVYKSFGTKLDEHLAQLLTHYSLQQLENDSTSKDGRKMIGAYKETFKKLNKHQPSKYRIGDFLEAEGVTQDRVIESIRLLRKGWLKGIFDAWSIVIKW
ncbi:MAG: hypothetical protein ACOC5D_05495 [Thermoplasmatota archaeon]